MTRKLSFLHQDLRRRTRRAFTILEIVIVLAIIVLILTLGVANLGNIFSAASEDVAKTWVNDSVRVPLETYRAHMGTYPSTEQGFQALIADPTGGGGRWRGPYVNFNTVPLDPWGNPYQYRYPGTRNSSGPDIYSWGPDGRDSDQNIGNW